LLVVLISFTLQLAEKFDQAITDYEAGLEFKKKLLPFSSRQIAEAHYKLSIVLDMTPGRLSDSITHAEQAHSSIQDRITELKGAQSSPAAETKSDPKGKGKAAMGSEITSMTPAQIEVEIKELTELGEDLKLKVSFMLFISLSSN
jgi:HAT1-interacting factor 1